MNRTAGVIRTFYTDKTNCFFVPYMILLSSFLVNLVVSFFMDEGYYTGGISSIHIFMFVLGILFSVQSFPLVLGFGARRKDFFAGTVLAFLMLSVVNSLLLVVLGAIEQASGGWGQELHFFHLPYMNDGNVLVQFWVQLTLMTHLFFSGFVIAAVYRRFGRIGVWLLSLLLFVAGTVGVLLLTYYEAWTKVWNWFDGYTAGEAASLLWVLTLLYLGIAYLLFRRTTV
ncbi:hypothetical protein [Paenibacillus sp. NFR01]|uniref:hypothetical protein n=1 Tax=Paenibacillus sp. NFR01 TaxID=1566279 RepID=UPI0008CBD044|nr:hypothetical protein [Paenibacillus sp. NFR01]SET45379.1 hypothetical protein SAMN03159358_1728 [Paenibacillus sp. NFR01]